MAKQVATSFVSPVESELMLESIVFRPYLYLSESDPLEYYVATWQASYCPKEGFCDFPIGIYVSVFGQVVLTNPRNLEKRIEQRIKSR